MYSTVQTFSTRAIITYTIEAALVQEQLLHVIHTEAGTTSNTRISTTPSVRGRTPTTRAGISPSTEIGSTPSARADTTYALTVEVSQGCVYSGIDPNEMSAFQALAERGSSEKAPAHFRGGAGRHKAGPGQGIFDTICIVPNLT